MLKRGGLIMHTREILSEKQSDIAAAYWKFTLGQQAEKEHKMMWKIHQEVVWKVHKLREIIRDLSAEFDDKIDKKQVQSEHIQGLLSMERSDSFVNKNR